MAALAFGALCKEVEFGLTRTSVALISQPHPRALSIELFFDIVHILVW